MTLGEASLSDRRACPAQHRGLKARCDKRGSARGRRRARMRTPRPPSMHHPSMPAACRSGAGATAGFQAVCKGPGIGASCALAVLGWGCGGAWPAGLDGAGAGWTAWAGIGVGDPGLRPRRVLGGMAIPGIRWHGWARRRSAGRKRLVAPPSAARRAWLAGAWWQSWVVLMVASPVSRAPAGGFACGPVRPGRCWPPCCRSCCSSLAWRGG